MSHAFILGASSTLAASICRQLAGEVKAFTLVGRDVAKLERVQRDLIARHGVTAGIVTVDLLTPFDARTLMTMAEAARGPLTHFFSFPGNMGNGNAVDAANIAALAMVNYTAPAQFIAVATQLMEPRKSGHIVVISSVAGDRGRASNYGYGAAKAALSTFTNGLRHRLHGSGVQVLLVKPGFIASPMTDGMTSKLIASPDAVASVILRAMETGRGSIYAPWFWQIIMGILQHIPAPIFHRLKL